MFDVQHTSLKGTWQLIMVTKTFRGTIFLFCKITAKYLTIYKNVCNVCLLMKEINTISDQINAYAISEACSECYRCSGNDITVMNWKEMFDLFHACLGKVKTHKPQDRQDNNVYVWDAVSNKSDVLLL